MGKRQPTVRIVEPRPAPEIFVTSVSPPERIAGGGVRVTCYSDRPAGPEEQTATVNRVIVARIVFTEDGYLDALCQFKDEITKAVLSGACAGAGVN